MVLADFVRLPRAARVVDLGSGGRPFGAFCSAARLRTAPSQALSYRQRPIRLPWTTLPGTGWTGSAASWGICGRCEPCCQGASFPAWSPIPPISPGAPSAGVAGPQARQERTCTLSDVYEVAAWLLRFGGDCFLVHRPERLADLMALGRQWRLEPKRMQPGASQARRSGQFGSAPMPPGGEAGAVPAAGPHPVPC